MRGADKDGPSQRCQFCRIRRSDDAQAPRQAADCWFCHLMDGSPDLSREPGLHCPAPQAQVCHIQLCK